MVTKRKSNKVVRNSPNKEITIGEFPISELVTLRDLAYYPGIKLWCAITIVTILNLVQIRYVLNTLPTSVVDRSR